MRTCFIFWAIFHIQLFFGFFSIRPPREKERKEEEKGEKREGKRKEGKMGKEKGKISGDR